MRRAGSFWSARREWLVLAIAALTIGGRPLAAQQPPPATPAETTAAAPVELKYRQYFIPNDRKTELTRGYLPLARDEFQELLEEVRQKAQSERLPVYLLGGRYFARLEQNRLVDGFAFWDFHNPSSVPVSTRVAPLGVATGVAVWQQPERPAAGMGVDAAGDTWVVVPQTGRLVLPWSLQGVGDASGGEGAVRFRVRVPSCPTNQLVLAVPQGQHPVAPQGIVSRWAFDAQPLQDVPEAQGFLAAAAGESNYWLIDFGANTDLSLQIEADENRQQQTALVTVRQSDQYTLFPWRLEQRTEVQFDVYRQPLNGLRIRTGAGVELLEARLGDEMIPWTSETAADGGAVHYQLQFPRALLGLNQVLRLVLHSPVVLDQPWTLPKVHCEDVFWQEGRAELVIAGVLELEQLDLQRAQQTKASLLPQDRASILLQGYAEDFQVAVQLGYRNAAIQAETGTSLRLDSEVVSGRMVADLRTDWGELFTLRARVPALWTIDRIEAQPAGALDAASGSWRLENGSLQLALRQPITPEQPLRLTIEGHRVAPPQTGGLSLGQLEFVRFLDTSRLRSLMHLHAAAPLQVVLTGDQELPRLDPRELAAPDRELLGGATEGVFFRREAASASLMANVIQETPSYLADVQVQLERLDGAWNETYVIRCTPEALPVRSIRVRLSEARSVPVTWRLAGEDEPLSAVLSSAMEREGSEENGVGESWDIDLPEARNDVFEIRGTRSLKGDQPMIAALASLPQAASETGRISIRSDQPLQIRNRGLEPMPFSVPQRELAARLRGVFRYQPSRDDQITVELERKPPTPLIWAWSAQYFTYVLADGRALSEAVFRLQNAGQREFTCVVPPEASQVEAYLDGARLELSDQGAGRMLVRLPVGQRYPTLRIRFLLSLEGGARWGRRLRPELPYPDVPVLHSQWNLFTAHDQWIYSPRSSTLLPKLSLASIPRRLLAPLLRSETLDGPHVSARDMLSRDFWLRRQETPSDLKRLLARHVPESAANWQQLIGGLATAAPRLSWHIDAYALAAEGTNPETVIGASRGAERATYGSVLRRAGLMLVASDRFVLVTSRESLAAFADQIAEGLPVPGMDHVASLTRPGWLSDLLRSPEAPQAGLLSPAAWSKWSVLAESDWASETPLAHLDAGGTNWYRFPLQLQDPRAQVATVYVISRGAVQLVGWGLFLLAAGLGWWLGRRSTSALIVFSAFCAALAMLVPAIVVSWGAGMFLGSVAGGALVLLRRGGNPPSGVRPELPSASRVARAAAALGVVGVACNLLAQQPPAPATEFRVLIPVDEQQVPVGTYVFVPRPLFEYLHLAADREPYDWLIERAEYAASVMSGSATDPLHVTSFTATFQIESFVPNQTVRIPLRRNEVQVVDAKLNGQTAEVRWASGDSEVQVSIEQPRVHELTLTLNTRKQNPAAVLDVSVPPVAHSTLRLSGLPSGVELQVPDAVGGISNTAEGLGVALGPTGRIRVQRAEMRPRMETAQVEVQQLLWLRVRPSGTVLDLKLSVNATGSPVENLTLLADSRLRPLPVGMNEPVDGEPSVRPGDYQQIRYELKEGIGQRFHVQLSFLITNTTGVGRVRLPRLELPNVTTTRRWLAVSHAPALELQAIETQGLTPLATEQFVEAWGRDSELPGLAYEAPAAAARGDLDWVAECRFQPVDREVDQRLQLHVAQESLRARFDAVINCTGGPVFQHRLAVPPNWEVDQITLWESDAELPVRWARPGPETLTVFLPTSASSRQRLVLTGRIPTNRRSALPVPIVQVQNARVTSRQLEVWRETDVQSVNVEQLAGWEPLAAPDSAGLWVGSWRQREPDGGAQPPRLTFQPNLRRAVGYLATRLLRSGGIWTAEAEYHLRVTQGVYDSIRLELPVEWQGPLTIEPNYPHELRTLPGQNRQQLVVRPPQPVTGTVALRIRGPLVVSGDRLRRVPDVVPLDVFRAQRYLVLPTRLETQQITWAPSGLQARPLPSVFRMAGQQTEAWESYQILGSRFHAAIRHVERVAGVAQVRLADVLLDWDGSRCTGVVALDIEPGGKSTCTVRVPDGTRVIYAALEGVPAMLTAAGENRWQVRLGPPQLPQRLEILFAGTARQGLPRRSEFTVPWCEDLPVLRTLWTVRYPWRLGRQTAEAEEAQVDSAEQEIARLSSLSALVGLAFESADGVGGEDATNWLRPWAERVAAARLRLDQQRMDASPGARRQIEQVLGKLDDTWSTKVSQLGAASFDSLLSGAAGAGPELSAAWRAASSGYTRTARLAFPGVAPDIALVAPPAAHALLYRCVMAGLLLATGLGCVLARRRDESWELWQEYPHALAGLLGLAWLVWLTPAAVGWLLMALAALAAWRHPWPKTAPPRR